MTAMSTAITRQIVLDTETTGMNQIGAHYEGHKIIEIGAVEVVNRRLTGNNFHVYTQPIAGGSGSLWGTWYCR